MKSSLGSENATFLTTWGCLFPGGRSVAELKTPRSKILIINVVSAHFRLPNEEKGNEVI